MNTLACIEFKLDWNSQEARHSDGYIGQAVTLARSEGMVQALEGCPPGTAFSRAIQAGESLPENRPDLRLHLKSAQFNRDFARGMRLEPRLGRFYPINILRDLPGSFQGNRHPCRCVGIENAHLRFDLNHPLSAYPLTFTATLLETLDSHAPERSGGRLDWLESAASNGPGMQARYPDLATDFWQDQPFARLLEEPDQAFYQKPRLVSHLDSQARTLLSALYGRLLRPGMKVLDLMSSWDSHLPDNLELAGLTGLGLNREELERNPRLSERVIHDLNQNPRLPFDDHRLDAVISSVSVEYLTRPFEVFAEVARVLVPGGLFALSFSNRWFPPKAIKLWGELHEFERMGLVLEYFLRNSLYCDLHTWSLRGYARPADDPYAGSMRLSDPLYAVWGQSAPT